MTPERRRVLVDVHAVIGAVLRAGRGEEPSAARGGDFLKRIVEFAARQVCRIVKCVDELLVRRRAGRDKAGAFLDENAVAAGGEVRGGSVVADEVACYEVLEAGDGDVVAEAGTARGKTRHEVMDELVVAADFLVDFDAVNLRRNRMLEA